MAIAMVIVYMAISLVLTAYTGQALISAMIADGVVILGGGILLLLLKNTTDAKPINSHGSFFLIIGTMLMWVVSQSVALCLMYKGYKIPQNSDISYDQIGLYYILCLFLAPLGEEIMMRGFVFRNIAHRNKLMAYLLSVVLFALMHGNIVQGATALLCGFWFCYVMDLTGNVRYSIFCHMLFNAMTMLLTTLVQGSVHRFFYHPVTTSVFIILFIAAMTFLVTYKNAVFQHITAPSHNSSSMDVSVDG